MRDAWDRLSYLVSVDTKYDVAPKRNRRHPRSDVRFNIGRTSITHTGWDEGYKTLAMLKSTKFILLINVEMPTFVGISTFICRVGISTFICRIIQYLRILKQDKSLLFSILVIWAFESSSSVVLSMESFITSMHDICLQMERRCMTYQCLCDVDLRYVARKPFHQFLFCPWYVM